MNTSLASQKKKFLFGIFVVCAILGGIAWSLAYDAPAPAVTFTSLKGEKIPLASLKGKVVLVNFWATSCPGCIHEMPELINTYQLYRPKGFETVAVAMQYDPPNYVVNFVENRKLPFIVALDIQGEIARLFGNVQLTPTSFLIDKQGKIIQQTVGELDFKKFRALLERELSK